MPVLSEKWMDVAKLIAVSIVLPDEVVRFQASNPRWEPRRAFVCVKGERRSGVFLVGQLDVRDGEGWGRTIMAAMLNER